MPGNEKSPTREFRIGARVEVTDPDFDDGAANTGRVHGIDKKTGDVLVVLDDEPQAARRIRPAHVRPLKPD